MAEISFGDYAVQTQIGAGPDGACFRARDCDNGHPVEVHLLDAAHRDPVRWPILTKRIRTALLIDDPAVVQIRAFAEDHAPPYLVLDWDDCKTLSDSVEDRLPLPEVEAITIALDLSSALVAAHKLGLTHGSISPQSVRISALNGVRLDFIGALTNEADHPTNPPVEPADDILGLGRLLHWLLSGQTSPDLNAGQPASVDPEVTAETLFYSSPGSSENDLALTLDRLVQELTVPEPANRPLAREVLAQLAAVRIQMMPLIGSETSDSSFSKFEGGASSSSSFVLTPSSRTSSSETVDPIARGRLGRYLLLGKLGQGGMGAVYKGEDLADGTLVAIKVLRPEWANKPGAFRRFQKEARLLGEVNNPFVTNLLEVNEDEGVHYLVLEFVEGQSLGQLLESQGKLGETEAMSIVADVARALCDAHERGIVHRDIKPDNILLSGVSSPERKVKAKLSDFGLARHVVESESLQVTQAQAVVGTPQYMAPEQGNGDPVDSRTDVYAIGITLYQMLAGQVPFTATRLMDLIALHTNEPPPPLTKYNPLVSDGASRIVMKALAKNPQSRQADASVLLVEIERLLRGEATPEAAHPRLPMEDARDLLQFDFTWELESSPRQLWPMVTNTERLNHAIGLPPVTFRNETDPATGRVRRFGEARQGGMVAEWEEHPFEWIEPRRMGVLREYRRGPFKWMVSALELTPKAHGGTTLVHRIRIAPRGALMRAAASLKVGRDSKKALERVYRRIDASLTGRLSGAGAIDPFEEPAALPLAKRRRLERLLEGLTKRGVHASVVEKFGEFLAGAPGQEVSRIRPLALARRLGLDSNQLISACLHGAHDGLLILMWDILCPVCRIPSEVMDTLRVLRDHGHCEACNLDYDLDFSNSVEMIFRIHPEVREADLGVYCIGGPSHSPHVVAQVRVGAHERIEIDLGLSEGTYQVRGPQLPFAHEFRVEPSFGPRRLELELKRGPEPDSPRVVRAGAQVLELRNDFDREMVARIERTASRDDALTAARASSLALFRELFPGEILSPGQLISIAATTLMITEIDDAEHLYSSAGDAKAFAIIHEQIRLIEARIRAEGGALVKTIGEGVLGAFSDSSSAVRVALDLAEVIASGESTKGLRIRASVHRGPAMAATINDHLDYFGLTVAQATALLRSSKGSDVILSQAVASDPSVMAALRARRRESEVLTADLPGAPQSIVHRFSY